MSLSSLQLEAFYRVARSDSFSAAARLLGLSQPALSQRIINLETELKLKLLIRDASGMRLTQAGERLLRYCKIQDALECELLGELKGNGNGLHGTIKIGGFSTVMRSRVLPKLDPLMQTNSNVKIEVFIRELRDLPALIRAGEIDFAVLDHALEGCASEELESEVYVLAKRAKGPEHSDVFLDHDPEDRTTIRFLGVNNSLTRSFLDDIEGILYGVSRGWGRAVVPRHLVELHKDIIEVKGHKISRSPVFLNWYAEAHTTELRKSVVLALRPEK